MPRRCLSLLCVQNMASGTVQNPSLLSERLYYSAQFFIFVLLFSFLLYWLLFSLPSTVLSDHCMKLCCGLGAGRE